MKKLLLLILFTTSIFANSYQRLLFSGNCVTCHDIEKSKSAPNIKKIQKAYKGAFPKKSDFIFYMSTWVFNPDEKTSIMQDDIIKYKIMPHLYYDKKTLEEISEYIYDTDFSKSN